MKCELFLSIIIPVYNCEKYISKCIDSCLGQDISNNNYEIICINDGSTDSSEVILNKYSSHFKNIKVFQKRNSGVSAARNLGIQKAKGKYLMFLDSDDFLAQNCLGRCKSLLESNSKAVLCLGRYHFIENKNSNKNIIINQGEYIGCKPSSGYVTSRIFPEHFVSHLRFQENIAYGEDEIYMFEINMLGLNTVLLDEPIYYYRIHEDSACAMTPDKRVKRMESQINSLLYIRHNYDLSLDKVKWFFDHRMEMTLDLMVYIRLKDKIRFFNILNKLDLLKDFFNSERSPNSLIIYIKYFIRVNYKRIIRKLKKLRLTKQMKKHF